MDLEQETTMRGRVVAQSRQSNALRVVLGSLITVITLCVTLWLFRGYQISSIPSGSRGELLPLEFFALSTLAMVAWVAVRDRRKLRTLQQIHAEAEPLSVQASQPHDAQARDVAAMSRANEVAAAGLWQWTPGNDEVEWDSTTGRIYGREPGKTSFSEWLELAHGADRDAVDLALHELLREGETANLEFRIFRTDGLLRFVSLSCGVVLDEYGKVETVAGVTIDVTDRKISHARTSRVAHHDSLTGLPNRELLYDRIRVSVERARRYNSTLGLLMIDLDAFKRTNDGLGHRLGDEVLKMTAARLKAQFRAADTVARVGGDEFVALLPDLHSDEDAMKLGMKALAALQEPMSVGGLEVRVHASMGIAIYPGCDADPDVLMHNADSATYAAKARGGNNVQMFTAEMNEAAAKKSRMEEALRQAIRNEEFHLVYQPQVSLSVERVTGVEALIRWHSPTLGTVMPLDFIALAEETGLIVQIGEWVLRTACRDAIRIQEMLGRPITMAVNLSPRQFEQETLSDLIDTVLSESGLAPNLLELEITENMLVSESAGALATLNRIRGLGVRLSIDDFGTGFSSMSYIIKFNVDRLKIDRSFVSDSTTDASCRTVTKAIIGLAHDLKIDVVAEGVETEEQRKFLVRQGCNDAQGYLFSKPIPLEQLAAEFHSIEGSNSAVRAAAAMKLYVMSH